MGEVTVDDDLAIDDSWQSFQDRPAAGDKDDVDELDQEAEAVVYATPPETPGEETVENVPTPDDGPQRPEHSGQTTLDEFGWSA